ncbi:putative serine aminopeptidase, S33, alpha/Beta hydrolase [Helianthus annuus]|nr:putative serine aminopeptidase, S33, alpha/Beta hydrolase [Helianthus annuus]
MARIIINNKPGLRLYTQFVQRSIIFPFTSTRLIETLAFEEIQSPSHKPTPDHSTFVLHGLIDWKMVLVDLRNHGQSAGVSGLHPPHDIVNAANDLASLVKVHGWKWPDVVLGHSMGSKVALQFALSCARGDYGGSATLPKQVFSYKSLYRVADGLETFIRCLPTGMI